MSVPNGNKRINWTMIVVIVYATVMVAINGVLLLMAGKEARDIAIRPAEFTEDYSTPTEAALCPGDTLQFDLFFQVNRDGVNVIYETYYNLDTQFTVIRSTGPAYVIVKKPSNTGQTVARIKVPELPPGHYEYRRAMHGVKGDTGPDVIAVPFEIRKDCTK